MNFTYVFNDYPVLKKVFTCEYQEVAPGDSTEIQHIVDFEEILKRLKYLKSSISSKRKGAHILQMRYGIGLLLRNLKGVSSPMLFFERITTLGFDERKVEEHIEYAKLIDQYPMLVYSGLEYCVLKSNVEELSNWFKTQEASELDYESKLNPDFWKPPPPSYEIDISFQQMAL